MYNNFAHCMVHPKKIVIIIVKIGLHVDTETIRKQIICDISFEVVAFWYNFSP